MILTRVPVGAAARTAAAGPGPTYIDTDAEDARARLAALYEPPRASWLRLNLVVSVDGSLVGSDGGSDSLTNAVDRMLMGVIRASADVVLIGASSIRREGLHVPGRARLAIVTTTGDLGDLVAPAGLEPGRVVVIGSADATAEAARRYPGLRAEPVVLAPGEVPPRGAPAAGMLAAVSIVDALRVRGWESILCEGGPTLAGRLLDADLVDELCLTVSPMLASTHVPLRGAPGRPASTGRPPGVDLPLEPIQLLVDEDGTTYARWAVSGR